MTRLCSREYGNYFCFKLAQVFNFSCCCAVRSLSRITQYSQLYWRTNDVCYLPRPENQWRILSQRRAMSTFILLLVTDRSLYYVLVGFVRMTGSQLLLPTTSSSLLQHNTEHCTLYCTLYCTVYCSPAVMHTVLCTEKAGPGTTGQATNAPTASTTLPHTMHSHTSSS